jgi:putative redox protein
MMRAKVTFCDGLRFLGEGESGHAVVMDGPSRAGGSDSAPRPAELLLIGLAGCTGMDVLSILRKKRQAVSGLEVTVRGEQKEGYPAPFERFAVKYTVRGDDVDPEAVRRSIQLSEEKYCTVGATLAAGAPIESEFEILPTE